MVKQCFAISILFFLFTGCERKSKKTSDESFDQKIVTPVKVKLNFEGYTVNQVTGDSIKPIVLENGDSVVSGVSVRLKGNFISGDSVPQPDEYPYNPPVISKKFRSEEYIVKTKRKEILVKSLVPVPLKSEPLDIEMQTDTIREVLKESEGVIYNLINPKSIRALSPEFNDDTKFDFRALDVDQGLHSSYAMAIIEARDKTLWFGGEDGVLSRYDGTFLTHYVDIGFGENIANAIAAIKQDNKGNVWIGSKKGISCFNGEYFITFNAADSLNINSVTSILIDRHHNIWFGTDGGGAIKYDGENFINYSVRNGLSGNHITSIIEDSNDNIWFSTANHGANCLNGESLTYLTEDNGLFSNKVLGMIEDKEGGIWFGSSTAVISRYFQSRFVNYDKEDGIGGYSFSSFSLDKNNNLWVNTFGGGTSYFDGNNFTVYDESNGLHNNNIYTVIEGSNNKMWFGTWGGGLSCFDKLSFEHITEKDGLTNNFIWCFMEDSSNGIWFGSIGGGLNILRGDSVVHIGSEHGFYVPSIVSILETQDYIWLGSPGAGLIRFDGKSFAYFNQKHGLPQNNILCSIEDRNGNLWFGTYNGISKYDGENFTNYSINEGFNNSTVWSVLEDSEGNIWFGTGGSGLIKFDGAEFITFTEKEGLSDNTVYSLLEDSEGHIWFSSMMGATMFDGKTFEHYTEKEGLLNNVAPSIIEDNNGHIWMGTESGINQIYRENGITTRIIPYGKNEGLKGLDYFMNGVQLDAQNNLWFASSKGVEMIKLDSLEMPVSVPKINLNGIEINSEYIDFRNLPEQHLDIVFDSVKRFTNIPNRLALPYDKNHLTINFSAIDWESPGVLKYSYCLAGLNDKWSRPKNETKVDFTSLDHGTYTFKLRAIGRGGEWSEPLEYHFVIHPPWWGTIWAKAGYLFLLILLIYLIVQIRTYKLNSAKKELKVKIELATISIKNKKDKIEKQHNEIKDSIAYAKRIQNAILSHPKIVKEYLSESFILYIPKDVVAGDFYWMQHIENKTLFAAADCTGHGVPGAIISVLCSQALNRCVREYRLSDPASILNKTREIVVNEFERSEEKVNDGMDIALCVLDGLQLKYAGAYRPLWIVRNHKIIEIQADKQPIGKFDNPYPYTCHKIDLEVGDIIYLFSDGYADQFGGEKGKKMLNKRFKALLLQHCNKDMDDQKRILFEAFEKWKGDLEQVDDVCVIGVKIQ